MTETARGRSCENPESNHGESQIEKSYAKMQRMCDEVDDMRVSDR